MPSTTVPIIRLFDWIMDALKTSPAAELNYGDRHMSDEERARITSVWEDNGLSVEWRTEGASWVARFSKQSQPVKPNEIALTGGLFGGNTFQSGAALPDSIAIIGTRDLWEHYRKNPQGQYVGSHSGTVVEQGAVRFTPIRRGNRVLSLEPYVDGDY